MDYSTEEPLFQFQLNIVYPHLVWHPHLHALMTDGVFDEHGGFHPLQHLSLSYLKQVFEGKVLIGLRKKELISEETIKLIQSWQHTGFHVHS